MTKYELPPEVTTRYFNDCRNIARVATTMTADALTKDLIQVIEIKREYWNQLGERDRVAAYDDMLSHLKEFLET